MEKSYGGLIVLGKNWTNPLYWEKHPLEGVGIFREREELIESGQSAQ